MRIGPRAEHHVGAGGTASIVGVLYHCCLPAFKEPGIAEHAEGLGLLQAPAAQREPGFGVPSLQRGAGATPSHHFPDTLWVWAMVGFAMQSSVFPEQGCAHGTAPMTPCILLLPCMGMLQSWCCLLHGAVAFSVVRGKGKGLGCHHCGCM